MPARILPSKLRWTRQPARRRSPALQSLSTLEQYTVSSLIMSEDPELDVLLEGLEDKPDPDKKVSHQHSNTVPSTAIIVAGV